MCKACVVCRTLSKQRHDCGRMMNLHLFPSKGSTAQLSFPGESLNIQTASTGGMILFDGEENELPQRETRPSSRRQQKTSAPVFGAQSPRGPLKRRVSPPLMPSHRSLNGREPDGRFARALIHTHTLSTQCVCFQQTLPDPRHHTHTHTHTRFFRYLSHSFH